MRVDLDAKVIAVDGEEIGSVDRAVVDPRTNEVSEFVVNTGGLFGHDVLLPSAEIERAAADGDTIRLGLTKQEVEDLPAYIPSNYTVPPAGWVAPGAYGFGYGAYLWPVAYPTYAAAAVPTAGYAGAGQTDQTTDESPSIGKGAMVIDSKGDDIGAVDDVRFDQGSGQLTGFVLRIGGTLSTLFGGGESVNVDAELVERVGEGAVYLRVSKEELNQLLKSAPRR